jgi:WD40 repeat protein
LYSGVAGSVVRVWSAVDGSDLGALKGHTDAVLAVAVGADGTVYSGSEDFTLRMWSGLDGSPIRTLQMGDGVLCIVIGAGNTVLISDGENRVRVWNGGATPVRTLGTFESFVDVMAIDQNGRLFIACREDRKVYEL